MHTLSEYKDFVSSRKNLVFLTGAGVSTLSGIKDFRSADGLYQEDTIIPPEVMLSSMFFQQHTDLFYEFYKNKFDLRGYEPNVIHKHISELEKEGHNVHVITQNVDGLHQLAGSSNVIEYHGTIYKNFCIDCLEEYDADFVFNATKTPHCLHCGGIIKPDIILYGEAPESPWTVMSGIEKPDAFIGMGTSLLVAPANTFIHYCVSHSIPIVIINRDKTPFDDCATILVQDDFKNLFKEKIL